MKLLISLFVLTLLTTPVFAQVISIDEASYLKYTLELEKLQKERLILISDRDALLQTEDVKSTDTKQIIIDAAEVNIDAKEVEITNKQSALDSLSN